MSRAAILAVLLLAACGDNAPAPRTAPLYADGAHLRDELGRITLLRGVNARVEGVFDVTFDDGRMPVEEIPPLLEQDCVRMRALGIDVLRLPINWSGVEPQRDEIDEDYLQRVDAAIDCAGDAGVLVVVDLHQDAYSKEIGEDGAPLWAIQPPPDMLLEGPLTDLGARRASPQVARAFETFFEIGDPSGLQAEFNEMLAVVAARWAEHPAVIGFELYNEPVVGQTEVDAFNFIAAETVRTAAPGKLVFFEPSAVRNLFDFIPLSSDPFPVDGAVYAPHIYTYVFAEDQTNIEELEADDLEPSMRNAREEADAWGTPLFVGEFALGPTSPNADLWMNVQAELHDKYLASDAFWVWKENVQASWGVHDWDPDTDSWTERPQVVAWLSRVSARRIAGEVIENRWDRTTRALRLEVDRAGSVPHEVYIPEASATTYQVTCNGEAVEASRDARSGLISLPCDGVLEVAP